MAGVTSTNSGQSGNESMVPQFEVTAAMASGIAPPLSAMTETFAAVNSSATTPANSGVVKAPALEPATTMSVAEGKRSIRVAIAVEALTKPLCCTTTPSP